METITCPLKPKNALSKENPHLPSALVDDFDTNKIVWAKSRNPGYDLMRMATFKNGKGLVLIHLETRYSHFETTAADNAKDVAHKVKKMIDEYKSGKSISLV